MKSGITGAPDDLPEDPSTGKDEDQRGYDLNDSRLDRERMDSLKKDVRSEYDNTF